MSDGQSGFVGDNEPSFNYGFSANYSFLLNKKESNILKNPFIFFFSVGLGYDKVSTTRKNLSTQKVDDNGNILDDKKESFKAIFSYEYIAFNLNVHWQIVRNNSFLIEFITGLEQGLYLSQKTYYEPKSIADTKVSHFYFTQEEEEPPFKGASFHFAICSSFFISKNWSVDTEIKYSHDIFYHFVLPFYKIGSKLGISFYF